MIKSKKSPSSKTLRNKLNKLFNSYIVLRDGKCFLTGDTVGLQCSHYYDFKQTPFLRYDERNAHAMANHKGNAIHFRHHHGKAPDYAYMMYKVNGFKFMEKLYKDSKRNKVYTIKDYIYLIKYYAKKMNILYKR
jgi:hypothetical protein